MMGNQVLPIPATTDRKSGDQAGQDWYYLIPSLRSPDPNGDIDLTGDHGAAPSLVAPRQAGTPA